MSVVESSYTYTFLIYFTNFHADSEQLQSETVLSIYNCKCVKQICQCKMSTYCEISSKVLLLTADPPQNDTAIF